jgi:MYXO-CTERM domain-containing protein
VRIAEPDADGDGYTPSSGDCDDADAGANPAADEACAEPEADRDCDGAPAASDTDCIEDTAVDSGAASADTGAGPTPDTDTDTVEPSDEAPPCGCASGPPNARGATAVWATLALALAAHLRRRHQESA